MDAQTFAHLSQWIAQWVSEAEQVATLSRIMDFVRDYPDLLETRTWTEIRSLAERTL